MLDTTLLYISRAFLLRASFMGGVIKDRILNAGAVAYG